MGKIISKIIRPIRMINIDNRAEKIISKSKPTPAPTYSSTQKQLELAKQAYPTFMEDHYKKDIKLDLNLKEVYVTSQDKHITTQSQSTCKKFLPVKRANSEEFEYGVWEPEIVPPGKISLRNALELLAANALQPRLNNKIKLSKKYNLDPLTTENLINHYRILTKIVTDDTAKQNESKNIGQYFKQITKTMFEAPKPPKENS